MPQTLQVKVADGALQILPLPLEPANLIPLSSMPIITYPTYLLFFGVQTRAPNILSNSPNFSLMWAWVSIRISAIELNVIRTKQINHKLKSFYILTFIAYRLTVHSELYIYIYIIMISFHANFI